MNDRKLEMHTSMNVPEGVNVIQLPPRTEKQFKGVDHTRVISKGLKELFLAEQLQSSDKEILMLMIPYLQYGNFFSIPITKFAELIGKKQPNISRSIKALVAAGYLQPFTKKDRVTTYMINPYLVFKGYSHNWKKAKELWAQINLARNPNDSLLGDI
jgi:hypothetical protein